MKSSAASLIVFLAGFALGSVVFLVAPTQPSRASATLRAQAPVQINWGEGSEADLSRGR